MRLTQVTLKFREHSIQGCRRQSETVLEIMGDSEQLQIA